MNKSCWPERRKTENNLQQQSFVQLQILKLVSVKVLKSPGLLNNGGSHLTMERQQLQFGMVRGYLNSEKENLQLKSHQLPTLSLRLKSSRTLLKLVNLTHNWKQRQSSCEAGSKSEFHKSAAASTDKYFMNISEVISVNLGKRQQQRKRLLPSTPIPDQLKRELVIRNLTKQLTQKSNLPDPTQQDVNAALERYKMMQKRVDLEYEKQLNSVQQRQRTH